MTDAPAHKPPDDFDWSRHDGVSENTCSCKCGATFRSHTRFDPEGPRMVARTPCPNCGNATMLRKVSSDVERYEITPAGQVVPPPAVTTVDRVVERLQLQIHELEFTNHDLRAELAIVTEERDGLRATLDSLGVRRARPT